MDKFKIIDFKDLKLNPFEKIGNEWMLITAGDEQKQNAMTASWGALGVMWGKNVTFVGIRPQRYTKEFVDKNNKFSLCFFDKSHKKTLSYFGSVSGRNEDKIKTSGLNVVFNDGVPMFEEASLVLVCKKLYKQEIKPECFIDPTLDSKWYANHDYHDLYISEIEKILVK